MSYIDSVLDRAYKNVIARIWNNAKPKNKYKRRVKNRNKLYKYRLQLGRVKRKRKGGK
ncbi:hypothetical protein [Clostridium niameyense]|uniref:hypothetical protein n=1 Tax=Clostridium niameyense TaxID=1622073 RepID=UPI000AC027AC|nr:hypothetical protein [Clostridium niameyense]